MTPFASLLYFGISLYLVIPLIIMFLVGLSRRNWPWILFGSFSFLIIQYWSRFTAFHVRELWVVVGSAIVQWYSAKLFLWWRARNPHSVPFAVALLVSAGPLLSVRICSDIFGLTSTIFAFMGISYVTFRSLDVIFGIRDGQIKSLPFKEYLCYLTFFATISSGPIDRFNRFRGDWAKVRNRQEFWDDLDRGIGHIFRGLLYKFIIAALINHHALEPLSQHSGFLVSLGYMYAYSLFLFFDFAGYSAFAIGFGRLFGVHVPANFDKPFWSKNIREFWNRWHMSLSFWFRDHIYMRFLLTATKQRWFRGRHTGSYIGFMITMVSMGLWHGLRWHYLVYGLYHACLLIGYDSFARWNKSRHVLEGPLGAAAARFITFHAACFGMLIFSGHL